ncbi:hypothetical protein [Lacrimispora amygdalina]|uniref:hypothetical protein n=1 Tax=Lacrimispora amygdalina TaxID=253257 RepID=UPI000BE33831|nr:hypothetical protein [Lacrimispora amygdalina]
MEKEFHSLEEYSDRIQIDTKYPIPSLSYINRSRQTVRMHYAANLNKIDIAQKNDLTNFDISEQQAISSVLLLSLKEYIMTTRKKDIIGRVYFNCNVLRESRTNCDIFVPKFQIVFNVDGSPHGNKTNIRNDLKNLPKYIEAGYKLILFRDETLDTIPFCENVKIKGYLNIELKKVILKTFCKAFEINDIFEYEYDEIIKLSKSKDFYLSNDEIKRCELLYKNLINDYDGYLAAWEYDRKNRKVA